MNKTILATGLAALLTASTALADEPEQANELSSEGNVTITGGVGYTFEEDETTANFDFVMGRMPLAIPKLPVFGQFNLDLEAHTQLMIYNPAPGLDPDLSTEMIGRLSLLSHYLDKIKKGHSVNFYRFIELGPSLHILRPYGRQHPSLLGGGFLRFGVTNNDEHHYVRLGVEGNSDSVLFSGGYNALEKVTDFLSVGGYVGGSFPTLNGDEKIVRRDNEFAGSFEVRPKADINGFTIETYLKFDGLSHYAYEHGALPVKVGWSVGSNF